MNKYKDESGDVAGEFPISSSIKVMMGSKLDDDCIKKVQTDAITKGLSRLGFNADVFMGRFDGNKYVDAKGGVPSIQVNYPESQDSKEEWI